MHDKVGGVGEVGRVKVDARGESAETTFTLRDILLENESALVCLSQVGRWPISCPGGRLRL